MASSPPTQSAIPDALLEYNQWLCWREEERDGKPTKIPIDPATGELASTTDAATWTSFETARDCIESDEVDGLGFVFSEDDPLVGVDLDGCRDPETGQPEDWAKSVIEALDSFTEVSPSGTGYHVLVRGALPEGRNRKGNLELYETARFFTVTADHVDGTPTELQERTAALEEIHREYLAEPKVQSGRASQHAPATSTTSLDDGELLRKAKDASNGEKFARLWRGDTSGYESHSEADMALCSLLAFWTGGDERQMDQLFRDSGLMREKWDEVHYADGNTYGEKTIERAIAGTDEFYEPRQGQPDEEPTVVPPVDLEQVRTREADRLEQLDALQQRLTEVLEEKEQLEAELEAERARRREVESQLEDDRAAGSFVGELLDGIRD